jgi:hypothetical protein
MAGKGWQGRVFTSLLSLVSFLVLSITGIILYLTPQGRVAYWVDWHLLGLDKTQWGNIHVLGALLFIISGIFHIYYNWKPLVNYLSSKAAAGFKYKKELGISGVIFLWMLVSGISSLPPLSYVLDWSEQIKDAWIVSEDYEPPFGHAEQVSLQNFIKKQNIPAEKALDALNRAGIKAEDLTKSVGAIAAENGVSPMKFYMTIKALEPKMETPKQGALWTPELVEKTFAGKGLGKKTLDQIAQQLKLDLAKVQTKLSAAGIKMESKDKFKDIATKNKITPLDLMKKILLK